MANFSSDPTTTAAKQDKRYLATVHIALSDSKDAALLNLDLSRDKSHLIAAKLWESEETVTTANIGYNGDGPVAGLRFTWHY